MEDRGRGAGQRGKRRHHGPCGSDGARVQLRFVGPQPLEPAREHVSLLAGPVIAAAERRGHWWNRRRARPTARAWRSAPGAPAARAAPARDPAELERPNAIVGAEHRRDDHGRVAPAGRAVRDGHGLDSAGREHSSRTRPGGPRWPGARRDGRRGARRRSTADPRAPAAAGRLRAVWSTSGSPRHRRARPARSPSRARALALRSGSGNHWAATTVSSHAYSSVRPAPERGQARRSGSAATAIPSGSSAGSSAGISRSRVSRPLRPMNGLGAGATSASIRSGQSGSPRRKGSGARRRIAAAVHVAGRRHRRRRPARRSPRGMRRSRRRRGRRPAVRRPRHGRARRRTCRGRRRVAQHRLVEVEQPRATRVDHDLVGGEVAVTERRRTVDGKSHGDLPREAGDRAPALRQQPADEARRGRELVRLVERPRPRAGQRPVGGAAPRAPRRPRRRSPPAGRSASPSGAPAAIPR